jgi:hypothetical protein
MIRANSKCGHVVRWKHHPNHLEAFSHYKFSCLINCDGPKEQDVIARKDILKTPLKDPKIQILYGNVGRLVRNFGEGLKGCLFFFSFFLFLFAFSLSILFFMFFSGIFVFLGFRVF